MYKTIILILLLSVSAQSAEMLVLAKTHWMQDADTAGWDRNQKLERQQSKTKGHPIDIRPDGFKWGSKECAPVFIIVKVDGLPVDSLKKYLEPMVDSTGFGDEKPYPLLMERAYKIDESFVDFVITNLNGVVTVTNTVLKNNISKDNIDNLEFKKYEK